MPSRNAASSTVSSSSAWKTWLLGRTVTWLGMAKRDYSGRAG